MSLSAPYQSQWRAVSWGIVAANLLAVAAIAGSKWPSPAEAFGGRFEGSPMAWATSVQLVLAGFTAALVFFLSRVGRDGGAGPLWIWAAFALGLIFLGLDEYLAIHERIDDRFAAKLGLPGQPPVTHAVLLLGGLFPAWLFWRHYRDERTVRAWFAAALGMSAAGILIDHFDHASLGGLDTARRVAEDCIELFAGGAFLLCFLSVLFVTVQRLSSP